MLGHQQVLRTGAGRLLTPARAGCSLGGPFQETKSALTTACTSRSRNVTVMRRSRALIGPELTKRKVGPARLSFPRMDFNALAPASDRGLKTKMRPH
jgi:hypothetical protein